MQSTAYATIAAARVILPESALLRKLKKAREGRKGAKREARVAAKGAAKAEAKEAVKAEAKRPGGVQHAKSMDAFRINAV